MPSEPRGYVSFDALTEQAFIDLVQQTLESSDYIETEWHEGPPHTPDDVGGPAKQDNRNGQDSKNPADVLLVKEVVGDGLIETPSNAVALAEGRTPEEAEAVRQEVNP